MPDHVVLSVRDTAATMPTRKVVAMLSGAFGYMRPGGRFYQMTVGPCRREAL